MIKLLKRKKISKLNNPITEINKDLKSTDRAKVFVPNLKKMLKVI